MTTRPSRTIVLSGVLMLLAACAPRVQERFFKAGATEAEWKRDQYECARDASMVVVDQYTYVTQSRIAVDRRMFALCLEARGWDRRTEPTR